MLKPKTSKPTCDYMFWTCCCSIQESKKQMDHEMDIEKFEMTQKVPCSDMLDGVAPRTSPLQPAATGH
jgi:hypothetical protein